MIIMNINQLICIWRKGCYNPPHHRTPKRASILLCKLETLHNEISSCKIHNLHKEGWGKDVKPKTTPSPALLEADFSVSFDIWYLTVVITWDIQELLQLTLNTLVCSMPNLNHVTFWVCMILFWCIKSENF